jgi:rod shape-determining protein MreC
MPSFNLLLEPLDRLVTFLLRRRGLTVALAAVIIFFLGTATPLVRRPPLLTSAVEGISALFMRVLSRPVRTVSSISGEPPSERMMRLELELARLREAERENRRLRDLLNYEPSPLYEVRAGRIIGLDLDPLMGVAWISLGRGDGLQGGEAVLTVDGLIGVVSEVWSGRARARLLRNASTPVSVRDTRSRALGILEWDPGTSGLEVRHVPFQTDIAKGDTLLTSGLGGVFPPGLPVGTVADVSEPPERLVKSVRVEPFASFDRLEEIFALMAWEGPWLPTGSDEGTGVVPDGVELGSDPGISEELPENGP